MARKMKLTTALRILVEAHTGADDQAGYRVTHLPDLDHQPFTRSEYIEAWGVMRDFINSDRADIFTKLDRIDFKPCEGCGMDIGVGWSDCPHCGRLYWYDDDGRRISG